MDDQQQLSRIESKIDRLDERLDNVDVRLAKYNAELEFHIARTNQIEDDLLPVAQHVQQVNAGIKLLAAIAAIVGFAITVANFLKG